MRVPRILAVSVMAALLAACSGGGLRSVPSTTSPQSVGAAGPSIASRTIHDGAYTLHVLPARGVSVLSDYAQGITALSSAAAKTSSNLVYHGGPVQTTPQIFVVYWGPKWSTSDPEYTTLNGFFSKIGGGGWINIDTQYYQTFGGTTTSVSNPRSQLIATWIDTSSVPSHPNTSDVGAEAQRAEQHFASTAGGSHAYSVNNNYVVAIQSGNDPGGFKGSWCAFHSTESESEGTVSFTDFPYQSDAGFSCGVGAVNSPGTYDGVSIVGGHEEAETQTDPQLNAWYDSSGSEIGDKCAWQNLENNPNAGGYPTQPLWDNAQSSCQQSGP